MKKRTTKDLVLINILLLIPFIIYSLYKNGYLLYAKKLISFSMIFKPLYLVLISIVIKFIIDLIIHHKLLINYNLLYVILISMIMPYNINLVLYSITFTISYFILTIIENKIKFNKVCLIYLIIVLINGLYNNFSFLSPLESKYTFSFSFFDLLMGRCTGGIASTSIFFSLLTYSVFINSYYYKKDIPLVINITYLLLAFITYFIMKDSSILLNSEIIFGSIFISTLPKYSPYKMKWQIIYGMFVGILAFIISFFDKTICIYLATFIISLFANFSKKKVN